MLNRSRQDADLYCSFFFPFLLLISSQESSKSLFEIADFFEI